MSERTDEQRTIPLSARDQGVGAFGERSTYEGNVLTTSEPMKETRPDGGTMYCLVAVLWLAMTDETAVAWARV